MRPEVEKLFYELADLTPQERAAYFAGHRIEAETRREVERLLAFDGAPDLMLDAAVGSAAVAVVNPQLTPHAGRRCGPYNLMEALGQGGMGAVYRAERADGEIHQQVAIKLLHAGAGRPGWQERFLRERQLLSGLNHPSVARLLDAGHTDDGQPYLVMELVDGVAIDRYAEGLGLRRQIEVFLGVCDAVDHAHRNLIIHRDLKPSNILVDSSGQPKLLDFGIARLIDETADPTKTVDRMLTPSYASPEQVSGARQTTATDVYSLGAILYRIVAGRSPHETEAGSGAAIDILTGHRDIAPPSRINPDLPADVDCILMKALRREPGERYPSAAALSEDLRRFLDNKPIAARPDSLGYRASKFLRRNRAAAAVVLLISVALLVTGAFAVRQAIDARNRFSQVRKMARTFLFEFHDELDRVPGTTKAKALLASTAREYLDNLARSAGNDGGLLLELAEAYDRLAAVQGGSSSVNLAQRNAALDSRQRAAAIRRRRAGQDPAQDRFLVSGLAQIAEDLRNLGRLDEAMSAGREAVELGDKLLKGTSRDLVRERSKAHGNLARALQDLGRLEEAESQMKASEELLAAASNNRLSRDMIVARQDRADLLYSLGRTAEAVSLMEQAERDGAQLIAEAAPGGPQMAALRNRQYTWASLAEAYDNPLGPNLDQPDRALAYREKLCKGWEHLLSLDPSNAFALTDLAVCESETALTLLKVKPRDAVRIARQGLGKLEKLELDHSNDAAIQYRSARAATRLALSLLAAGEAREALQQLQPSLRKHRELISKGKGNPRYQLSLAWSLMALARIEASLGNPDPARTALKEAIQLAEPLTNSLDLPYLRVATEAHQAYAEIAPGGERCRSLQRARELWANWKGSGSPWVDARREQAGRLAASCPIAADARR